MSDLGNDDTVRNATVNFRTIALDEGRSISVGYADDRDDVFIRMVNNQGTETKFALHEPAAAALLQLLALGRHGEASPDVVLLKIIGEMAGAVVEHGARVTGLLEANNREIERRRMAERERDEARSILDGFRRIGFKPCKDPSCYRGTLDMMQRADAALCDFGTDAARDV